MHPPLRLYVHRAAGPFTPRNGPGVTPRSCGIATCLNRATDTVGLSPTGLWPCRPLHTRQTKTLPPTSVVPNTAGLCRLLPVPAGKWPFPALSLQSLYRCLDPYPAVLLRCTCSFLPEEHRPHVRSETFGTPTYSHIATSVGHAFRGCSHSVMFRLPCSLGPQVAPTAEKLLRAAGPFTPRTGHVVTHMNCGIATYLNRAIDMAGLSPAGLQPCRLLPRSGHEELPHPAPTLGGNAEALFATSRTRLRALDKSFGLT